jgi:hypothetical protein
LILWSGANDVGKNYTMKAFRCLVDFAKNSGRTNTILASVPHRHDLIPSSCVNEEVRAFNQNLIKIRKIFGHVSVMVKVKVKESRNRPCVTERIPGGLGSQIS